MRLNNHICTDKCVCGVPFSAKIIKPCGANNARVLKKLRKINYICVHNTGNTSISAGDEAHASYLQNVENVDKDYVSWHITVDCDSATQHLPFDEMGYHAGDGSTGSGNAESIGIEICENKNYPQAEINGIKIICALMHEYKIPIERVLPHRYFAPRKKLCPHLILKSQKHWRSNWCSFQARVMREYEEMFG